MRSNRTVDVNTGGEHTDPSASGHLQKAQMDVIRRKDIRATSVETLADVSSNSIFVMILPAGFYNYPGLFEMGDSILVEKCKERIVVVDGNNRRLLRVDDEDLSGVKRNQILDLNDEGDRWEGDVLNDEPFGWGVMYDKEGRKVYEGFRLGGEAACYGRKYYADISRVEYDGEWCVGRRWGRGTQYDRNGVVVYEGEWVDDGHLEGKMVITTKNHRFVNLHNRIEELHVDSCCCNQKKWRVFDLPRAVAEAALCGRLLLQECGRVEAGRAECAGECGDRQDQLHGRQWSVQREASLLSEGLPASEGVDGRSQLLCRFQRM